MTINRHRFLTGVCYLLGIALVVLVVMLIGYLGRLLGLGKPGSLVELVIRVGLISPIFCLMIFASLVIPALLFEHFTRAECPQCERQSCRESNEGVFVRNMKFNPGAKPKPGQRTSSYYKCEHCGWEEEGERA